MEKQASNTNEPGQLPGDRDDLSLQEGRAARRAALLLRARESSTSPGVYMMKDAAGGIIYVGKAKNLKNRLSTYFQAPAHEVLRTELMVGFVNHFDVILTETEAEALILECTLIKKHKPKFNVRLKDDKAYPYLKVQVAEDFPRIQWTRRVMRDGARYFGPFPSAWTARQVMDLLNETFQLRDCSENTFRHRSRPCILYQMGKCTAPCVGKIVRGSYHEAIDEVIAILEGRGEKFMASLHKGMEDAVEDEDFELAAEYRDQIKNLELVTQTQGVQEAGSQRDRDVVGIARKGPESGALAHATVLRIRSGRMVAVKHFVLQNAEGSLPDAEVLADFLAQYYLGGEGASRTAEGEEPAAGAGPTEPAQGGREVLVPQVPGDLELLERTLGVALRVAEDRPGQEAQSRVDQQLLSVARTNAEYALEQSLRKSGGHGLEALEEIREKLHLPRLPSRIECYDNSNIQGEDAVASRVVFINGAPDKNLYRRYKIRTVEGANDFATMREVLGRRFANREEEHPDLVVVDGGKGQLSQAVAIMDELGIRDVPVVGLAKARTESDFQSSELKSSMERIFIPNRKNPVPLFPHTGAYKLLTHVRDEAHRFAISYHRLLRGKRSLKTESS